MVAAWIRFPDSLLSERPALLAWEFHSWRTACPGDVRGKVQRGSIIRPRVLETISGEHVSVPDTTRLIHMQFRRFASCPVCNLHLRSIVRRHAEIASDGIREVVVFHSNREEQLKHAADLPFAVIADPRKELYAEFGRPGLPADFLIASDGQVLAVKYGAHAYDQWSVDELLAEARQATQPRTLLLGVGAPG